MKKTPPLLIIPVGELVMSTNGSLGIIIDTYYSAWESKQVYAIDWFSVTPVDSTPDIGLQYALLHSTETTEEHYKRYIDYCKANNIARSINKIDRYLTHTYL